MTNNNEPTPQTPPALPFNAPTKRILANSKHGDTIWQMCQPLLDFLLQNGNEDMRAQALKARAYWETEQGYFIDWGNKTRFFEFAELAVQDVVTFRKLLATMPAETQMRIDYYPDGQEEPVEVDVVAWLALKAGERVNKARTPTGKIVQGVWKRKKGKRG